MLSNLNRSQLGVGSKKFSDTVSGNLDLKNVLQKIDTFPLPALRRTFIVIFLQVVIKDCIGVYTEQRT